MDSIHLNFIAGSIRSMDFNAVSPDLNSNFDHYVFKQPSGCLLPFKDLTFLLLLNVTVLSRVQKSNSGKNMKTAFILGDAKKQFVYFYFQGGFRLRFVGGFTIIY